MNRETITQSLEQNLIYPSIRYYFNIHLGVADKFALIRELEIVGCTHLPEQLLYIRDYLWRMGYRSKLFSEIIETDKFNEEIATQHPEAYLDS